MVFKLMVSTLLLALTVVSAIAGNPTPIDGNPLMHSTSTMDRGLSEGRPNFVVILTDDLDWNLGIHASTLQHTRRLIGEEGVTLTDWLVQTPVCCGSRAELLTGKMFHNLRFSFEDYSAFSFMDFQANSAWMGWSMLVLGVIIVIVELLIIRFYMKMTKTSRVRRMMAAATIFTTIAAICLVAFLLRGHNRNTQPKERGCMHIDVSDDMSHPFYDQDYFARHFRELNYTVGIFGKHLNVENPSFLPDGVDEMLINGGGTFMNPEFMVGNRNSLLESPRRVTFDNCTAVTGMPCYSTSVIGNASLAWIQRHTATKDKGDNTAKPFFALISLKAPHIEDGDGFPKAIPAPWYENATVPESIAPRTPNYNCSAEDHHWLARSQMPVTAKEAEEADKLYVSRIKSLMSVDDMVQDLVQLLEDRALLSNTYIVFTSDNGYKLGQFRMFGKWAAYEEDIRIPMMIRGPGIQPNSSSTLMGTHVDLIPTLLGMAGQAHIPDTMDGRNLASCLHGKEGDNCELSDSSVLVEYFSLGENLARYNHTFDVYNHSFNALRLRQSHDANESSVSDHWIYSFDSSGLNIMRDMKYVEYRNWHDDWNASRPPLEIEVFDLERDPYEMRNLHDVVHPDLLELLQGKLQRLLRCRGESCRQEHNIGIDEG